MRSSDVVPPDPLPDSRLRLRRTVKAMLPDTLLLQALKESLRNPVLLRRVWRVELLGQPIIAAGCSESPALEDQPVVDSNHGGCPCRFQQHDPIDPEGGELT